MKQITVLIFCFFCVAVSASAQTYYNLAPNAYPVTYTQTINGTTISITPLATGQPWGHCAINSGYSLSCSNCQSGYRFKLSPPVAAIRLLVEFEVDGSPIDTVGIKVNGSPYYVSNFNLSSWGYSQNLCQSNSNKVLALGGNIVDTSTNSPGSPESSVQFDVHPGSSIDSIDVYGKAGGFAFYFSNSCYGNAVATSDTPCAGKTLHLYSSSSGLSGGTVTYSWSGPNGFSSTQQNPVINNVTTAAEGLYTFTLVDDTCTYYGYVNAHIIPVPAISVSSNSPICTSDSLIFSLSNTLPGIAYSWSGPNSFSSTQQNPKKYNVQFADSGTYTVIANLSGCKDTVTSNVSVKQKPGKPVASSNSPLCSGRSLGLGASSTTTGVNYNWTGPSYSSSQQNPSIASASVSNSGSYIVSANLNGCIAKDTTIVNVAQGPDSSYAYSNAPLCPGDSLHLFSGSSQASATYSWSGPNSFSSALQNPGRSNVQYADSGDYKMISNLNSCKDTLTVHVSVRPTPNKPVANTNSPLCSWNTLHLLVTNPQGGVNYQWSGPSYSSTQQNPNINPALASNAGAYIVTANLNGCTAKDTTNVIITQGPDSVYAYLNSPLCTTDTLHLNAGSLTAGVSFSWSGPSYSSSNANSIISNVALSNAGTYYLTASLGSCVVHDTLQVTVNQKPAAATVGSNSPVCEGSSLSLTSSSTTAGVSYSWTGPNAYSVNAQNPTRTNIVMTDSGSYFAKVTLGVCSTVSAIYVMTKPRPQAVTITNNSPVCAGDSLKLTVSNSQPGVSYGWTLPSNSTVSTQNLGIANAGSANAGNYVLTSTLNGCARYDTVNAVVKPLPALPNITSNSAVCVGDSLALTVSNWQSGISYQWSGPASFSDTGHQTKRLNMTMAYTGYYKVLATLNGCSVIDSTNVQVNPLPNIPIASSNSPVCVGDSLKLTVSNSQSGASYSWTGPASFGANIANPVRINTQASYAGTYTVTANLNGCTETGNTTVTVNPQVGPPAISISVSPGDTVCAGTNLTFTASATNAGGPIYTWLKNGAGLGAGNTAAITTASVSNGDHISCKVTSNTPCQAIDTAISNAILFDIISNPPPVISISNYPTTYTVGTLVTFTGHVPTGSTGLTYAWTVNGVFVTGQTTTFYATNSVGPSDVVCFVAYSNVPCTIPDSSLACAGATGVAPPGPLKGEALLVYPNPVQESLTLSLLRQAQYDNGEGTVRVFDAIGQLVYTSAVHNGNNVIDMKHFVSGVYMVQVVYSDGGKEIRKIIKE